ncbi:MAG: ribose-phosphate pyrophosphokinase-like domain-containing protein [Patescibacteria group bacterium]|jgi:phosphoribosylpyrophosphate synthetase
MAKSEQIMLFCGRGDTNHLAADIINVVNNRRIGESRLELDHTDFEHFPDGEPDFAFEKWHKIRGKDAVLFVSTHSLELVLEALILIYAIKKRYGAKSLTVVQPFMAFRRQDHPEINEEFHLNYWFIYNLKANGADRLILCDVHSEETRQNCELVGLEYHHVKPTPLYAAALREPIAQASELGKQTKVLSADMGSLLRTIALAKILKLPVLLSLKKRKETGNIVTNVPPTPAHLEMITKMEAEHDIKIELMSEEAVKDVYIIIREDELDTAGTASDTCRDLLQAHAYRVDLVVTHMKCSPGWKRKAGRRKNCPFTQVIAGDTIYRGSYENRTGGIIQHVSVAPVIAEKLTEILDAL